MKIDPQLKLAIKRFIIREIPINYSGHAQDITDELENYLNELGFDLECVVQHKPKKET